MWETYYTFKSTYLGVKRHKKPQAPQSKLCGLSPHPPPPRTQRPLSRRRYTPGAQYTRTSGVASGVVSSCHTICLISWGSSLSLIFHYVCNLQVDEFGGCWNYVITKQQQDLCSQLCDYGTATNSKRSLKITDPVDCLTTEGVNRVDLNTVTTDNKDFPARLSRNSHYSRPAEITLTN